MANPEYLKCPGGDPLSKAMPEVFACAVCATDIEIWSDETGGKCVSCGSYFKKSQISGASQGSSDDKLRDLVRYARQSGASEAAIISAKDIVIDTDLANKCLEPKCENYGRSKSCPPHVSGPVVFSKQLENFNRAIFFKLDVPSKLLYSSERREIFQLLHELASSIERYAIEKGFANAQAYAGGSCKKIFCHEFNECLAVLENGKCRNPQRARPSMSGFGIDVAKLIKTAGWHATNHLHDPTSKMENVFSLVLIH